jgi:hypothetical protein
MRNVSLKHFGDSVVTFKKPISSIKSSLFFLYLSSQEKKTHRMVAPDKKTLKKSVKSMFFMVQTRCEVETIKY